MTKPSPKLRYEEKVKYFLSLFVLLSLCLSCQAWAESVAEYDVERLATAIYYAEGGARTNWPYGILKRYKTTTPRQACINTIRNQSKRHAAHQCSMDYLSCLAKRYAPINSDTDNGTNRYWLKNVRYFLKVGKRLS